jgi:hypothetical protein
MIETLNSQNMSVQTQMDLFDANIVKQHEFSDAQNQTESFY